MFHVKPFLYVRTEMTVPGAGVVAHLAEMKVLDDTMCRLHRMIELDPHGSIVGAVNHGKTVGGSQPPNELVPHPDTYGEYPDITALPLGEGEFEGLWSEARALFPNL